MNKALIYLPLLLLCSVFLFLIKKDNSLTDFLVDIAAASSFILLELTISNFEHLWLWLKTHTIYYNKDIRMSISYLFRIKIDDKYLLIRGNRIRNQYQPIGGVYKRFRESYYALENLKIRDDYNIPIDDLSIGDLRVKLPGKNVVTFIKWYNSQLGREVSPYREFYEELIRPGILSQKDFPYINYLHKYRHQTKIRFSVHFQCHEILIAEIFQIMPNDEQKLAFKNLMLSDNNNLMWFSEDEIKRRGTKPGVNSEFLISESSEWIL